MPHAGRVTTWAVYKPRVVTTTSVLSVDGDLALVLTERVAGWLAWIAACVFDGGIGTVGLQGWLSCRDLVWFLSRMWTAGTSHSVVSAWELSGAATWPSGKHALS